MAPKSIQLLEFFLALLCLHHLCGGAHHALAANSCRQLERQALVKFKEGLKDPSNLLASWAGEDCCSWPGVGCDNITGSVVHLDLHYHYSSIQSKPLGGEIDPSLLNLQSLNYLDLSNNSFEDISIPPFIGSFKELGYLNLSLGGFSGSIPRQLGNLSSLQYLDLSYNNLHLDDCRWLSNLTSLQYLDMSLVTFVSSTSNWLHILNMLPSITNIHLSNCHLTEIPISLAHVNFTSLSVLDLSGNSINSLLPFWLFNLTRLKHLNLAYNNFYGPKPTSLGILSSLEELRLAGNKLNGTIPQSLGQLTNLIHLDLSSNSFDGVLSETHFADLSRLKNIYLNGNPSLSLKVSSDWLPPFRLEYADMSSCLVGPQFPTWLKIQDALYHLNLSNAGISDTLPDWLWNTSRRLRTLDMTHNAIWGAIPNTLQQMDIDYIDLSFNSLSGTIPLRIGEAMPLLSSLSISTNNLSGILPSSICRMMNLELLDLSKNHLTGKLPSCWTSDSALVYLHLENNNLTGGMPDFYLPRLKTLHLCNNTLSGELPLSLKNFKSLEILDIGHNKFTGNIAPWIGESLSNLSIISLRANMFTGNVPPQLTSLRALQILDLSSNNLSGAIPHGFGNFSAMKVTHNLTFQQPNLFSDYMLLDMKGREDSYRRDLLSLVTLIDLSDNGLSGSIPEELATLHGLQSLNLSRNRLEGAITGKFGGLQQLESLDLSRNKLSGAIPSTLTSLRFLNHLNLSDNNLSGRIPSGEQFNTFTDQSIYLGNQGLCGFPLDQECPGDVAAPQGREENKRKGRTTQDQETDADEMIWLYLSLAPGFAIGFWAFWGVLACSKRWRVAYFQFIDEMWDKVYVITAIYSARLKKRLFRDDKMQISATSTTLVG